MADKKQASIKMDYIPTLDPPPGRMLVILLDSLRKDFAFSTYMPFISSCRERGAWGVSEVVSVPLSIAGDHAIFSATIANLFSVFEDFTGSTSTYDNLFKRITKRDKRAVILSSHCLRGAYGEYTDLSAFEPRHFLFSQYREDAIYLFKQSHRFLKKEKWDLAVVQFITLDYIGHLETPLSSDYSHTLLLIDDYVRQLVNLTTDQDIILITSEHGMDDHGFHMDSSEMVIETPFILFGPNVKKGGPREVLQIDWAPTLSVLAGVSPVYNSLALPALDLLKLSAKDNSILLKKFAVVITENSTSLTLSELREIRIAHNMVRKGTPLIGVLVILCTLLSMTLFAYVALFHGNHGWNERFRTITIGGGIIGLCSLIGILFYLGVLDYVFYHLPFSANFILTHPLKVTIAFALMAVIPMLYLRIFGMKKSNLKEVFLAFFFVFVFAGIFMSTNSYHFLNWAVLGIPLVAWGVTRRTAWINVFGAVWTGFVIRRLTFYNAYTPINLPDRWLIVTFILVIGLTFLWWLLKTDPIRIRTFELSILCFSPGIVIVAWPLNVEVRTILLLLGIIPVALLSSCEPKARNVLWAMWVVFFLLGTSSNINHTTHIVALPLFIALWSITKEASVVVKGLMVGLLVWTLYLLPGNSFNLKLLEMSDRFILGTAMTKHIEFTIAVIASRYILPPAVLIWVMKQIDSNTSMLAMASTIFLPVVCSMGIMFTILVLTPVNDIPWEQTVQLTILLGYLVVLISAFLVVALAMQVGKLFHYRTQGGKLSG